MGTVEIREDQVLEFAGPILGFESHRRFAILPAPDAGPFHLPQSLEDSQLAFLVVSREELGVAYRAEPEPLRKVGASSWDHVKVWMLVVIPPNGEPMQVNLRAPVVVNPETRLAAQIVMQEEYPMSHAVGDSVGASVP